MKLQDFIKNFHKDLWLNPNDLPYMSFRYYFSTKANDNYHDRQKPNFDPFYNVSEYDNNIPKEFGTYGKTNDKVISENMTYNYKLIIDKYIGDKTKLTKKFSIGDYNFYIYFNSGVFKEDDSSVNNTGYQIDEMSVYVEYHGFTHRILNLHKRDRKDKHKLTYRSIEYEGYFTVLEFLKNAEDLVFEDYDFEDVFGQWEENYKSSLDTVTPEFLCKYSKKKNEYRLSGYSFEPSTNIVDLDFFIKMFTSNGIYKPNKRIFLNLNSFNNRPKSKVKSLKDLDVEIVQFQNNSAYDITKFYNLNGVTVKCSKSVLGQYQNLRKFYINKEVADDISKKENEEKIRRERERKLEIANDTYTLYQFGVPILKDVRSYVIEEYFENRNDNVFETQAINEAKKIFNATSELDVIYFMHYGIYTYTEMSGEKFSNYEDLEYINKLKGNKLPKRIITLLDLEKISFPFFDTSDKNTDFDTGATFIGVKKVGDSYELVYEDGDQGI